MEANEIPMLCDECFLENLIKATVTVELHITGDIIDLEPLVMEMFFCPNCQNLRSEL